MNRDVNIYDVAKLAGVSISTVSRVINNHPDVSDKTRARVLRIISEHSYIPNDSARNLSREPVDAIGVVVKGFSNPFFHQMISTIQDELRCSKYTMLLHPVDPSSNEIIAGISFIKEKKPKGLIFLGGNFTQRAEKLSAMDVPFVITTITLQESIDKQLYSSVAIDNYREVYGITDMVCKSGHREIAAIGNLPGDKSISGLRVMGFLNALKDNGISADTACTAHTREYSMSEGYRAATELLRQGSYSCFICVADVLALGAMRAVRDAGLRIPEDISIIGFDGIEAGKYTYPRLSTVEQPAEQMARKGMRILLNRLEQGADNEHILLKATFYEGESFIPVKR